MRKMTSSSDKSSRHEKTLSAAKMKTYLKSIISLRIIRTCPWFLHSEATDELNHSDTCMSTLIRTAWAVILSHLCKNAINSKAEAWNSFIACN